MVLFEAVARNALPGVIESQEGAGTGACAPNWAIAWRSHGVEIVTNTGSVTIGRRGAYSLNRLIAARATRPPMLCATTAILLNG